MEKLITLYPHQSKYKSMFEKFNSVLFWLADEDLCKNWTEYMKIYKFHPTHFGGAGSFDHRNWKKLYDNVPESIELWTLTGIELEIKESLSYDKFSEILRNHNFTSPPIGTGLWLPEGLKEQNISFEGKLAVFSPIEPCSGKVYKTAQVVLQKHADFHDGEILATLEDLRPLETLVSPSIRRIVQKV